MRLVDNLSKQYSNIRFCGGKFLRLPSCRIGCIQREEIPSKIADSKISYYTEGCACAMVTMNIEDVEALIDEVSDIAYDKAVEIVTATVKKETHLEDIRLVEESKNWVLSPERKASKKEREYAAKRLDGVIAKIRNAMQSAVQKFQNKLIQPEVKKAGTEQIKAKARTSVLDKLNRKKAEINDRSSLKSINRIPYHSQEL